MTVLEKAAMIGKTVLFHPAGQARGAMAFEVVIEDVKEVWGTTRYLVRPIAGKGIVWTESISEIRE